MDFSTLDTRKKANEGSFLHLRHPGTKAKLYDSLPEGGDDLTRPVGIYMLGADSDKHTAWKHKRANQKIASKEEVVITSEEASADTDFMLANVCTGWENISLGDGRNSFSTENVLELFSKWKWAAEQALLHFVDRSNFI